MKKQIKVGGVTLGDGRVYIQSMLNVPSGDISGNARQAIELARAGCEILRVAIPAEADAKLIPEIKNALLHNGFSVPIVADIHFDATAAVAAISAGADKIRINPGNFPPQRLKSVVAAAKSYGIPIRVGVNGGSIAKDILQKHGGHANADALCESALSLTRLLEKLNFYQIVVSLKSSEICTTIDAYRQINALCDYPLHVGLTEAGTRRMGVIRSAVAIGALLSEGIGDTIRVSLTADPVEEVRAAKDILSALGLRPGPRVISCPTCGRTKIDVSGIAARVESALEQDGFSGKQITVAVMGCAVNGPGEAREADIGIAGGDGKGVIFSGGQIIGTVPEAELFDALMKEVEKFG